MNKRKLLKRFLFALLLFLAGISLSHYGDKIIKQANQQPQETASFKEADDAWEILNNKDDFTGKEQFAAVKIYPINMNKEIEASLYCPTDASQYTSGDYSSPGERKALKFEFTLLDTLGKPKEELYFDRSEPFQYRFDGGEISGFSRSPKYKNVAQLSFEMPPVPCQAHYSERGHDFGMFSCSEFGQVERPINKGDYENAGIGQLLRAQVLKVRIPIMGGGENADMTIDLSDLHDFFNQCPLVASYRQASSLYGIGDQTQMSSEVTPQSDTEHGTPAAIDPAVIKQQADSMKLYGEQHHGSPNYIRGHGQGIDFSATPIPGVGESKTLTLEEAGKEMGTAIADCKQKRISGALKTYVESAECSNPRIIEAFQQANYKYMDLINQFTAARVEISSRIDANQITEAEGNNEMKAAWQHGGDEEKTREASGRSSDTPNTSNSATQHLYPDQLASIIDASDWPSVHSALVAANGMGVSDPVQWINKSNNHKGMVRLTGTGADAQGCHQFRVIRVTPEHPLPDDATMSTHVDFCKNGTIK